MSDSKSLKAMGKPLNNMGIALDLLGTHSVIGSLASAQFSYYQALMDVGFSDEQAFTLLQQCDFNEILESVLQN